MKKILIAIVLLFLSVVSLATVEILISRTGLLTCDGNDVDFTFSFPYASTSEIKCALRVLTTGVESFPTNFTVSPSSSASGGTVTFAEAPANTYGLKIYRETAHSQSADIDAGGYISLTALENANDKLTRQIQDLQEQIDRCIKIPITDDPNISTTLQSSISRASKVLAFDVNGVPTLVTN